MSTQFESGDAFENASLMLEVCLETYKRGGFHKEVEQLRGLEATSPSAAYASLLSLERVRICNDDTRLVKRIAIDALRVIAESDSPSSILPLTG